MADAPNKTLMRSLGEFFGHVFRAVRSDPARGRSVLNRTVEEAQHGNVTLRRTVIEEIEVAAAGRTPSEPAR